MQETRVSKLFGFGIVAIVAIVALWSALFAAQPAHADELTAGDIALTSQSQDPNLGPAITKEIRIGASAKVTVDNNPKDKNGNPVEQTGNWTYEVTKGASCVAVTQGSGTGAKCPFTIKGVEDGTAVVKVTFTTDSGVAGSKNINVKVIGIKAKQTASNGLIYKRTGVDTVTLVGSSKKNLKSVTINTVKIGDKSGYAATYKVTAIGKNAINKQKKLTKIVVGKNVTAIGNHAFCANPKLTSLVIGANVKKIGQKIVHVNTTKLTTVTIKTTKLKPAAVKNCFKFSKVKTVKVPAAKKSYYKKKVFTKANCGKKVTVK